jgi:hypothetical protein
MKSKPEWLVAYGWRRIGRGVGVQPKIRVTPTLADFRAGKDTVLEAAEAYLRNHAPAK